MDILALNMLKLRNRTDEMKSVLADLQSRRIEAEKAFIKAVAEKYGNELPYDIVLCLEGQNILVQFDVEEWTITSVSPIDLIKIELAEASVIQSSQSNHVIKNPA